MSVDLWHGCNLPNISRNSSQETPPRSTIWGKWYAEKDNHTIHLQQSREEVYKRTQIVQEGIKKLFYKWTKANDFQVGNIVLKWDSRREEKWKHGKFENMWKGPYIIDLVRGNNAFFFKELDGIEMFGGPVNGRMLKHYFC